MAEQVEHRDCSVSYQEDRMVGRVAGSKHVGVVEVAAWDALLETESSDPQGGENANAAALGVELAKAFEKVQLTVVSQWTMWFRFPRRALESSL